MTVCSGRVRRRSDTVVRSGNCFQTAQPSAWKTNQDVVVGRPSGRLPVAVRSCRRTRRDSGGAPRGTRATLQCAARSNRLDGNGTEATYDEQRQFGQDLGDYGGHERIGQYHDGGIPHCRLK